MKEKSIFSRNVASKKIFFARTRKKLHGDVRKNWMSVSVNVQKFL